MDGRGTDEQQVGAHLRVCQVRDQLPGGVATGVSLHAVGMTAVLGGWRVGGKFPLNLVQIKSGTKGPIGTSRQAFAYKSLATPKL